VEVALELQPDMEVTELYQDVARALRLPHAPLASNFRQAVRAARNDYWAAASLGGCPALEGREGMC
jgi:hypothetical protein